MSPSPVINLADLEIRRLDPDTAPKGEPPDAYDVRWGEIASRIGARKLGYNLTVVAPGKRNCPFHSHHIDEEMFFIVEGTGQLRYGDKRYPLKPGDVIACPPGGPDTAHQIINTGTTEMRYLSISTMAPAEICEYPDSGKFGAFAGGTPETKSQARFRYLGKTEDQHDYWEGE
ncbi:MAG TPA: cupin domain-containing protein [Oleiagrimonas sp.]|nr:cupin domain-containing protein [Oleiagrimonas sp.]